MLKYFLSTLLLLTNILYAHPHLFIDMDATLNISNNTLTSIDYIWTFDEMFSSTIFMDYDSNKDKKFSKQEANKVYNEAFSNLSNFNYFTYINKVKFSSIKNFSVSKTSGKFQYEDLSGIFGQTYADKITTYLKKNNYLKNDLLMKENYLSNLNTIFKWIKNNCGEDGSHIVDFLKSSATYKVSYNFNIPTNIKIKNTTLKVHDETNFTAPELKSVKLSDNQKYFYKKKQNKILIGVN